MWAEADWKKKTNRNGFGVLNKQEKSEINPHAR